MNNQVLACIDHAGWAAQQPAAARKFAHVLRGRIRQFIIAKIAISIRRTPSVPVLLSR